MFFLAVASEFALTGLLPASAPEPVVMLERAPRATEISDLGAEAEEEVTATEVVAEAIASTVVEAAAEAAVSTEGPAPAPSIGPTPEPVSAPEEAEAVEEPQAAEAESIEEAVAASPEPGAGAMSSVGPPAAGDAEDDVERPAEEAPRASIAVATTAALPTLAPRPSPTLRPTLGPSVVATEADVSGPDAFEPEEPGDAAPTVVAEVQVPVPAEPEQKVAQSAGTSRESVIGWLGAAELALGIAFLVLGITTIAVMYRQRTRR
jgi:hypothetical protein